MNKNKKSSLKSSTAVGFSKTGSKFQQKKRPKSVSSTGTDSVFSFKEKRKQNKWGISRLMRKKSTCSDKPTSEIAGKEVKSFISSFKSKKKDDNKDNNSLDISVSDIEVIRRSPSDNLLDVMEVLADHDLDELRHCFIETSEKSNLEFEKKVVFQNGKVSLSEEQNDLELETTDGNIDNDTVEKNKTRFNARNFENSRKQDSDHLEWENTLDSRN